VCTASDRFETFHQVPARGQFKVDEKAAQKSVDTYLDHDRLSFFFHRLAGVVVVVSQLVDTGTDLV